MSKAGWFFRTTALIVAVTLVGRVIGFVRQVLITNEFGGLSAATDAYFLALNVPMTLFLVIPGAVNSVLIPTLKGMMGEERLADRNRLFHQLLTFVGVTFALLTAAGMVWSEEVVRVLAPGFDMDKQALTADVLRIMMPSVFFIGIASLLGGFLNAHNDFFASSLGTLFNGLIVIASIYILAPAQGIAGVAWGTMLGFAVFALYLVRPTARKRYSFRWNARLTGSPELRGMGERFVPILIGLMISQLYFFIEKIFAGHLGDAKVSAMSVANSFVQLPITIFSGALAMPLFPLLSEYVKAGRMEDMKSIMAKGFLYQYHVLLPATAGIVLLSKPIMELLFDHSADWTFEHTALAAWAVVFYSVGMIGWAGRDLLTRASYAIENTKTPVIAASISITLYLALSFALIPHLDHGGLALAYSLATFVNMFIQTWWLKRQIGRLFERRFYVSLLKGGVATVLMSGIVIALGKTAQALSGRGSHGGNTSAGASAAAGAGSGLAASGDAIHGLDSLNVAAVAGDATAVSQGDTAAIAAEVGAEWFAWLPVLPPGLAGALWLGAIIVVAAVVYFAVMLLSRDPYIAELVVRLKVPVPKRLLGAIAVATDSTIHESGESDSRSSKGVE